jgi:hypothetical protein
MAPGAPELLAEAYAYPLARTSASDALRTPIPMHSGCGNKRGVDKRGGVTGTKA